MRLAILGNSGSGKSTLARRLAGSDTPVLDLDTIVWEPDRIAVPRDPKIVLSDLLGFCSTHSHWIVEGCYAHCILAVLQLAPELIFLDPGPEACMNNCRNRPWEPHKYASKAEQDSKLEFLLGWVQGYYERDGDMSHTVHGALFDKYPGPKRRIKNLRDLQDISAGHE